MRTNAKELLKEGYWYTHTLLTLRESAVLESESDPDFYRWLFNDDIINDFGSNLTDDQIKETNKFFEAL
jgi:hypothetical protein